jgi:uncharacterized protein (TIGR02147 family)
MNLFSENEWRGLFRVWQNNQPNNGRGLIASVGEFLCMSSNQFSQMLSGHRKLSIENALELSEFMKLTDLEKEYFLALVEAENAGSQKLKDYWHNKAASICNESQTVRAIIRPEKELDDSAASKFYSSYLFSLIRLFCSTGKGKTLKQITGEFELEEDQAKRILNFLVEQGLVVEKEESYHLGAVSTHVSKGSLNLNRHHANWRIESLKHVDVIKEEEVMFTCPCSLDQETFDEVKSKILALISEAGDRVRQSDAKRVACLNIDFFWMTK